MNNGIGLAEKMLGLAGLRVFERLRRDAGRDHLRLEIWWISPVVRTVEDRRPLRRVGRLRSAGRRLFQ